MSLPGASGLGNLTNIMLLVICDPWIEMIFVTSVSCCLCCHKMESPYPLLDSPGEVVIISRPGFRLDFPKLTTRISQKWRLPFDLLAWSIRSFPLQGETNATAWFMGCLIYRRCHSRHYSYTHTSEKITTIREPAKKLLSRFFLLKGFPCFFVVVSIQTSFETKLWSKTQTESSSKALTNHLDQRQTKV